jgi:hypothetical protein
MNSYEAGGGEPEPETDHCLRQHGQGATASVSFYVQSFYVQSYSTVYSVILHLVIQS